MELFEKYALIYGINARLHEKNVGCPDTTLHVAVYFLQELLGVPLGFKFIIARNTVFSFKLHDSLNDMYGLMLLDLSSRGAPKSPEILPIERAKLFKKEYPDLLSQYQSEFNWVAEKFIDREDLEISLLGVAIYLLRSEKDMTYEEKIAYTLEIKSIAKATEDEVKLAFKEAERTLEEFHI
jgi:hypothetical protein